MTSLRFVAHSEAVTSGNGVLKLLVSQGFLSKLRLGGEDETCKILAQGFDLSWSGREPEFFRDRWRHTIKAQFVMAEAVNVLRFIG